MIANQFLHLGRLRSIEEFRGHLKLLELSIPCDLEVESGADSPLGDPIRCDEFQYGSDYLLGLAAFAPEKFAERDRRWETGEPAYYESSDALQHLGNVAFRPPVPAYKHSAAIFLNLLGRIPSPHTHPLSPRRPVWEAELLRECLNRLGYT